MKVQNPMTGRQTASGNYLGDNTVGRQITTGFKCGLVFVMAEVGNRVIMIPNASVGDTPAANNSDERANDYIHATDGFIVSTVGANLNFNLAPYHWWAMEA